MNSPVASAKLGFNGELLETVPLPPRVHSFLSKFREPNNCIYGYLNFFRRILPQVTGAPSLHPAYHGILRYHTTLPSL